MATIDFKDYIIEKSIYQINPKFVSPNEEHLLVIKEEFQAEVGIENNNGYVTINVKLGDLADYENIEHIPFYLETTIRGIFKYDISDDDSTDNLKVLLGSNAIAILYPYLRSHISLVTSSVNQFPAYILPVVNFVDMIKNEGKVEFKGFNNQD